ncbi:uncharacterized protein [Chelonus insularis]|uniref:uncharacterized protein n=1 Tax=Chelonus insularis TaxID=460826 RepID=UPI00158E2BE2|nr:uncharacterized protein LOC118067454 [Chelonus insularis]
MADKMMPSKYSRLLVLLFCLTFVGALATIPANLSPQNFSDLLVHKALTFLNAHSSTKHSYKNGKLVFAQPTYQRDYAIWKVSVILDPDCPEGSCSQEICEMNILQDVVNNLIVDNQSTQCSDFTPQTNQDSNEISQEHTSDRQEQEMIKDLEKQIINDSVKLDHEVQRVTSKNDKPFIAIRSTNYCPGCPYELNPNIPGLETFGEVVLKSLDDIQNNVFKYRIDRIVRVTRAIPPGLDVVRYELLMMIGETDCFKTSPIPRSECTFQSNKPLMLCLTVFDERPWLPDSREMVKNNCTESSDQLNQVNDFNRPELVGESLVLDNDKGETQEEEIKSTAHDQLAQEGQINTYKSIVDELLEVPVTKVQTGYQDKEIEPEVTEAPFKEITLKKEEIPKKPNKFSDKMKEFDEFLTDFDIPIKPTKPSEPIFNGPEVVEDVIRPERIESNLSDGSQDPLIQVARRKRSLRSENKFVMKLAQKAMNYLDDIDQDDNKRVIAKVLDSEKVEENNGIIYHITVLSASTNCSERQKNVKNCLHRSTDSLKICKIQINIENSNPLDTAKVIETQCFDKRGKRFKREAFVGGTTEIPIDNPDVQLYVKEGMEKYSSGYQGTKEPVVAEVVKATQQVVAGMLYKITVKIGESNCPKGQYSSNCLLADNSPTKLCVIEVWSRPWLNLREITVKCDDNRRKRGLKGQGYTTKMLKTAKEIEDERAFTKFQKRFNKSYGSDEERNYRFEIFKQNMITAKNFQKHEQGTATYGATIFADLTQEEFRKFTGLKPQLRSENQIPFPEADIPDIELPVEFDWRSKNVVTPVKNQGSCGSCWAFSVTGNVEGQYAIKHGKLLSLSEQELVDCDKLDDGCGGGLQENAYRALEEIGGLELEEDYPYDGEDETCHFKKGRVVVNVVSAVNISSNETKMAQWLVKNGPMAIGINANAMQFYMGGISHPWSFLCNKDNLDHGVLIVGYGVHKYPIFKKTIPYWIIKNSWGTHWGEQGYYRVYRGDSTCGVNTDVSSAIVA